jgi:small subunit ribosomal protein S16
MLAIRMQRRGASKRPFYRVVVTQSTSGRDSSAVEILGHYDPRTTPETLRIDRERFEHWLKSGARPSATVRTIVARHKQELAAPAPQVEAAEQPAS